MYLREYVKKFSYQLHSYNKKPNLEENMKNKTFIIALAAIIIALGGWYIYVSAARPAKHALCRQ